MKKLLNDNELLEQITGGRMEMLRDIQDPRELERVLDHSGIVLSTSNLNSRFNSTAIAGKNCSNSCPVIY